MRFPPAYQNAVIESIRSGMSLELASRFYGIRKDVLLRWVEGSKMLEDDVDESAFETRIGELERRIRELEEKR